MHVKRDWKGENTITGCTQNRKSSSAKLNVRKRPELVVSLLALRDTLVEEPLLHSIGVWQPVIVETFNRWIGEGGKATLVGTPDANILVAANEILWKRIAVGTATFLVKARAHWEEPTNEGPDILADKAISDPKVGKEWCQRTNRAVFKKKPCREAGKVTNQDRHSTFNNSVREAIRRGAVRNESLSTLHWAQIQATSTSVVQRATELGSRPAESRKSRKQRPGGKQAARKSWSEPTSMLTARWSWQVPILPQSRDLYPSWTRVTRPDVYPSKLPQAHFLMTRSHFRSLWGHWQTE